MNKKVSGNKEKSTLPKYALDRVIVKLRPETTRQISTTVPSTPLRYTSASVAEFGVSQLDKVAKEIGVVSLRSIGKPKYRLYDPLSTRFASSSAEAGAQIDALSSTFVAGLDRSTKVESAISKLKELPEVIDADYDYLRYTMAIPDDPSYPEQWGLIQMNCPEAWETVREGNVTVAVVDSGVELNHPDLRENLLPGYDFVDIRPGSIELKPGERWIGDIETRDNNPNDDGGHGTHVAGTIAAVTDNAVGVAGVAWKCAKILPIRVMASYVDQRGFVRGTGLDSDITTGIRWAADQAADVINLSLGGDIDSFVWRDAIRHAYSKNCVIVAAMGNSYESGNPIFYPAAYNNVLAVGAIDESGSRASFSNTGPHIDVAAPGVNILSTYLNAGYDSLNGTSMAAPHVSGLAALLKACNSRLSNTQIYNIIHQTARKVGDTPFNEEFGHGIVDAEAALNRCIISPRPSAASLPLTERRRQKMRRLADVSSEPRSGIVGMHPSERLSYDYNQEIIGTIENSLEEALMYIRKIKQS